MSEPRLAGRRGLIDAVEWLLIDRSRAQRARVVRLAKPLIDGPDEYAEGIRGGKLR